MGGQDDYVYIKILDNESFNCEGSLMADLRDSGVLATMDNRVLPWACIAMWQQQLLKFPGASQLLESAAESCSIKLSIKLMSHLHYFKQS